MKKALILTLFVSLVFTQAVSSLGSEKFSPGFRVGLSYSYFSDLKATYELHGRDNLHTLNFLFAVFNEMTINSQLSVINELSITGVDSKVNFDVGYDVGFANRYKAYYIHLPVLLRVQTFRFIKPHFLIGLDLGYHFDEEVLNVLGAGKEDAKNTDELPTFDISLNLGIGKRIELTNVFLVVEARCLIGLSKYSNYAQIKPGNRGVGEWRNNLFQVLLGIQLK